MKLWMDVMRDIEHVMDDYERLFDAWEAGGVDGLVIGPMMFDCPRLLPGVRIEAGAREANATFDPNPQVYRRLNVEPPSPPVPFAEKRVHLDQMLKSAKDRGWSVWIFQASAGSGPGGDGHILADQKSRSAFCARMIDTLEHYPMADGAIMDGPEWGYEIAPHHMNHRSFIFHDLPSSVAAKCSELGYSYDRLVAAKDRLFKQMHTLPSSSNSSDAPVEFDIFDSDPGVHEWLQFRIDSLTGFFRNVSECVRAETSHPIRLGVGPRTGAFARLCGYDFTRLAQFIDVLLPKHYFFHRGFDGMIGTVGRYVETLVEWNPGFNDADSLAVVRSLFGLELPGVNDRRDLEHALSPAFFNQIVVAETKKALAAVDDADRIVPWVDAGRSPHDGDPMPASQLHGILKASHSVGLRRFLYHHHGNLTAGEWAVMSGLCGKQWDPMKSQYRPPDMNVL